MAKAELSAQQPMGFTNKSVPSKQSRQFKVTYLESSTMDDRLDSTSYAASTRDHKPSPRQGGIKPYVAGYQLEQPINSQAYSLDSRPYRLSEDEQYQNINHFSDSLHLVNTRVTGEPPTTETHEEAAEGPLQRAIKSPRRFMSDDIPIKMQFIQKKKPKPDSMQSEQLKSLKERIQERIENAKKLKGFDSKKSQRFRSRSRERSSSSHKHYRSKSTKSAKSKSQSPKRTRHASNRSARAADQSPTAASSKPTKSKAKVVVKLNKEQLQSLKQLKQSKSPSNFNIFKDKKLKIKKQSEQEFYQKNMNWLKNKMELIQKKQADKESVEVEQCKFRPVVTERRRQSERSKEELVVLPVTYG